MKERADVQIVEFQERYAKDFAQLNYDWIERAYTVEKHDREILDHPIEQIIQLGGQIFFALIGDKAAGTVALVNSGEEEFELSKMAVSPDSRGFGIGNSLMAACIEYSRRRGKKRVILESNTKQVAAIRLYRKFGFQETPLDPNSLFQRANIRMELAIKTSDR
ncbi:MAG: GNAT family N-acetyltransferase [Acidobacteriota bacterium]